MVVGTTASESVPRVETPVLRFYDVNRPITFATDASKHEYGAVIMQTGQPVAYASRKTSTAGQNYAPARDPVLQPYLLRPYFDFRDEFVSCDGIIFWSNQIIVPKSLQNGMLG